MFEPPPEFKVAHIGLFWDRIRGEFPKVTEQAPLDLPREVEQEPRRSLEPTLRFETATAPPVRVWFVSKSGNELLQLQQDRFARNWRRGDVSGRYPSYENIRGPFERDLRTFEKFMSDEKLGALKPVQAEVTYVNHIRPGVWTTHSELDKVLVNWTAAQGQFLDAPEDARLAWRYVIRDGKKFAGRLHVAAQPAYAVDDPIFLLTLTARGNPLGPGIEGALKFLDLGHEWIVRGFADLTRPAMQQVWKREQ